MKIILILISIIILTAAQVHFAQTEGLSSHNYYQAALIFREQKEIDSAEIFLKKSISQNDDAPSLFELAKIYLDKKTVYSRIHARRLVERAVLKNPKNIQYRLLLAKLKEYVSRNLAYGEYENILDIDSTCTAALYNIGRIEEAQFDEFHNSFKKDGDDPVLSYEKFANEHFEKARNYFIETIKYDSTYSKAYLHLGFLFEDAEKPEKGILPLQKLLKINPNNKDAYLYLGLLSYETGKFKDAHKYYKNALMLMSPNDKLDFTFYSVKDLLKPVLGNEIKKMSNKELTQVINLFWKWNEPLFLTKVNESLLEYYSRVAYANLRFSIPRLGIVGWKSDRGEIYLRYGKPIRKVRYRPYMTGGEKSTVMAKTDVWQYKFTQIGFTDEYMSGNFTLSEPTEYGKNQSQFGGNSYSIAENLKRHSYFYYEPKFEGPVFAVPYKIIQFRDLSSRRNEYSTDLYVSYCLPAGDTLLKNNSFVYPHTFGIFFFDREMNLIAEEKDSLKTFTKQKELLLPGNKQFVVNSAYIKIEPDTGNFAFEIIRRKDKGVSSNHFPFKVKRFNPVEPGISDIVLASAIDLDGKKDYPLRREKITILPNPTGVFSPLQDLIIYYELYNLSPNTFNLYRFEQEISVQKIDSSEGIEKTFTTLLNLFGLGKTNNKKIALTSSYQTDKANPQMYLQLDMSKYEPGSYLLTVKIKDKISGKEVHSSTTLIWK